MNLRTLGRVVHSVREQFKNALFRRLDGDVESEALLANAIDATSLIAENKVRDWVGRSSALRKDFVETKYDNIAGSYNQAAYFGDDKIGTHMVDGEFVRCSYRDFFERKAGAYADFLGSLEGVETALEVGAGELTTTGALAIRFPGMKWHGVELSYNRVLHGREFFREHFGIDIPACKGDAIRLPFADQSFDLVITSHCLEHIPFGYQAAVDEITRVARRHVVLFEPVWETSDWAQKLRMYAQGYVRGLLPYVGSKANFTLAPAVVLDVGSPFNRTTRLHLSRTQAKPGGDTVLVCTSCRGPVEGTQTARTCDACHLLFPVVQGVPIMDPDDAYFVGRVS